MSRTLLALILALAVGCATAHVEPYGGTTAPPTDPATVRFFRQFPVEPYQVIGEASYLGAQYASWSGAETLLRKEAAKIGGDAVVVLLADEVVSATFTSPGQIKGTSHGTESGTFRPTAGAVQYNGAVNTTSEYTYKPPTTTEIKDKRVRGVVIRWFQPTTAAEWRMVGNQRGSNGQAHESWDAFQRAVAVDPADTASWTGLAILAQYFDDANGIAAALARLRELDPAEATRTEHTLAEFRRKYRP